MVLTFSLDIGTELHENKNFILILFLSHFHVASPCFYCSSGGTSLERAFRFLLSQPSFFSKGKLIKGGRNRVMIFYWLQFAVYAIGYHYIIHTDPLS